MCFSPEASFTGGVIISFVGVATVMKVHKPSQLIFASIPLFFGIQQFVEGLLWLTIPHPEYIAVRKFTTYMFLIMAEVLWPVVIPLSVIFMEENKKRKRILQALLAIGFMVSMYYGFCLLFFHVNPKVMHYHIQYANDFPKQFSMTAFVMYLVATITPLFVSSIIRTHILGVLMFLSCLVTAIFFTQYLTSVWCFFAALISGVIFWIIRDSKDKFTSDKTKL